MKKKGSKDEQPPEMLGEYDFRDGVRGKYVQRYTEGTNVVVIEPDVARVFPTAADVNRALRSLIARNQS
jgi:hypothetical protein